MGLVPGLPELFSTTRGLVIREALPFDGIIICASFFEPDVRMEETRQRPLVRGAPTGQEGSSALKAPRHTNSTLPWGSQLREGHMIRELLPPLFPTFEPSTPTKTRGRLNTPCLAYRSTTVMNPITWQRRLFWGAAWHNFERLAVGSTDRLISTVTQVARQSSGLR